MSYIVLCHIVPQVPCAYDRVPCAATPSSFVCTVAKAVKMLCHILSSVELCDDLKTFSIYQSDDDSKAHLSRWRKSKTREILNGMRRRGGASREYAFFLPEWFQLISEFKTPVNHSSFTRRLVHLLFYLEENEDCCLVCFGVITRSSGLRC